MSTLTQGRPVAQLAARADGITTIWLGGPIAREWAARVLLGFAVATGMTAGFLWMLGVGFGPVGLAGDNGIAANVITNVVAPDLTLVFVAALIAVAVGVFTRVRTWSYRWVALTAVALAQVAALGFMLTSLT